VILKYEGLKERVELLEIGEGLGYPRLGYGRSTKVPHDKRIKAGKDGWEQFCAHGHLTRILPALRIGRVLRDNNVEVFHPLSGKEVMPNEGSSTGLPADTMTGALTEVGLGILAGAPALDLLDDIAAPAPEMRETWMQPGTVAVYPPGKRRKYPVKKNKKKVEV
jgi:hypothetical protein